MKRQVLSIGVCRTRTLAERAAAERLEQLGINSEQTFVETTSTITFRAQGEIWLKSLANRKRNPLEQTTIDTRRYAMDKWIYPFFDGRRVADVNNLAMRDFVDRIIGSPLLRPVRLLAPLDGSDRGYPSHEGFYIQAFSVSVSFLAAGYHYDSLWTFCRWDSHPLE